MQKENKWISVLKEEPPAGQGVLIALNTGLITIGYRKIKKNSHDWQLFGDMNKSLVVGPDDYVTHWMPLPEPPQFLETPELKELHQYPSHWRKTISQNK